MVVVLLRVLLILVCQLTLHFLFTQENGWQRTRQFPSIGECKHRRGNGLTEGKFKEINTNLKRKRKIKKIKFYLCLLDVDYCNKEKDIFFLYLNQKNFLMFSFLFLKSKKCLNQTLCRLNRQRNLFYHVTPFNICNIFIKL